METGKRNIIEMIEEGDNRQLVLPEFQRSFIWSRGQVEKLLVSILNDYFIGSLLLLDIDPQDPPFAPRVLEGVKETEPKPKTMVLDGQQRVTSLYYVLYAPDIQLKNTVHPYRFFLDINKALDEDWDQAIFSLSIKDRKLNVYQTEAGQFNNNVLPVTFFRSWDIYDDWQEKYRSYLDNNGFYKLDRWRRFRAITRRFLTYEVAYVKLPRGTPLEKVVEIFENINMTGTPLSVFALVTARLYKDDVKLRDFWQRTYERYLEINKFSHEKDESFPKFILQIVALLKGIECKRKNLIMLESAGFERNWEIASEYAEKALKRLFYMGEGGYGVISKDWLPYSTVIPPLAALLKVAETDFIDDSRVYEKLHRWYWSSVFTERYSGASDTVIYNDYKNISEWFSDSEKLPESVVKASDLISRLDLVKSRRGAVYKGVISLIALNGAKDFITGDSISLHDLDDHHIFPKKHLSDQFKPDEINSILNRTLISRETNQKLIRDKEPKKYLEEMEKNMGIERVVKVLETHFINQEGIEAMRENKYKEFREIRGNEILKEMHKNCLYVTPSHS